MSPPSNPLVGINRRRAGWARRAVHAFMDETGLSEADGYDTAIGDLLADLMHLATELGLDFPELLARGERYHAGETASTCDACLRSHDAEADGASDLCIERDRSQSPLIDGGAP